MSATAKHTPGPWTLVKENGDRVIYASGDSLMCDAPYYPWCPDRDEDWRLIAAAPELLEALKLIQRCAQKQGWHNAYDTEMAAVDAAINKAEGRA